MSELEAAEGLIYLVRGLGAQHNSTLGKGTTFYSFLGVESTASIADIGKAYRKRSKRI